MSPGSLGEPVIKVHVVQNGIMLCIQREGINRSLEAHIVKILPVLLIAVVGGVGGFFLSLGWWKASGRAIDRDVVILMAKVFGSIACLGILLAFIMQAISQSIRFIYV